MKVVATVQDLRHELSQVTSKRVFVPTMGNLHDGHLSLVRTAHQHGQYIIVSIFVNRLQFEPHGDFDNYPRTLHDDIAQLEKEHVDLVFAPNEHELYPEPQQFILQPPAELSQILEGETRPNFFTGVCTIVMKLLWLVQPDVMILGKKDYQQLLILRKMCRQFNMPVEIVGGENMRHEDGLAMSSRNGFLNAEERQEAHMLYRILMWIAGEIEKNPLVEFEKLEQEAMTKLQGRGWKPYYIDIRERTELRRPAAGDKKLVVLAAAQLGSVRLIDNIEI